MATLDYLKLAKESVDRVYYNLETLCICFPGRISGSENLEKALDFLVEYGQENYPVGCCQAETVTCVPCWTRGDWRKETCSITIIPSTIAKPTPYPLQREMRVLANGLSVGTGPDGVSGEIVIIHSWEELTSIGESGGITNKIVLYDYQNWITYGDHAAFRGKGAHEAAKYGAVAVLIRTLTPNTSTSGPHTGSQRPYDDSVPAIPAACLSIEDTELLSRLAQRGHGLSATVTLPCSQGPDRLSRNIVFEIKGSELPDEVVVLGGHTDCWDCQHASCQGAHDDGQGVIIAMEVIRILLEAGVQPRRTIRAVLFVDEEVRQSGAVAYAEAHREEASSGKIVAAIETDLGVGPVCGFGYSGSDEGRQLLRTLLQPLGDALGESLGRSVVNVDDKWSGHGVDISPLIDRFKVPGLLLRHEDSWWNEEYFHFHHTASDTIDHVDKDKLMMNLAVLLGATWTLANSKETLPR